MMCGATVSRYAFREDGKGERFYCTRPQGHGGPHKATGSSPLAIWYDGFGWGTKRCMKANESGWGTCSLVKGHEGEHRGMQGHNLDGEQLVGCSPADNQRDEQERGVVEIFLGL